MIRELKCRKRWQRKFEMSYRKRRLGWFTFNNSEEKKEMSWRRRDERGRKAEGSSANEERRRIEGEKSD